MMSMQKLGSSTCGPYADLPLILILSVYTDFLTLKFGKIQIFPPEIRRNTDFFCEMPMVYPYTVLIHTDFFPYNTDCSGHIY